MMRIAMLLLFFVTANAGFSQDNKARSVLQRQRTTLSQQLDALNKKIEQADKNIHATAKQRLELREQMAACKEEISVLDKKLWVVENDMQQTDAQLSGMYNRLVKLKRSYAASLSLSWKLMNQVQMVQAIYTTDDANETQQRMQYIKILRRIQMQQAEQIRALQQEYNTRRQQLGITQQDMSNRLNQQLSVSAQLSGKEQTLTAEAQQLQKRKKEWQLLVKRKKDQQSVIENRLKALVAAAPRPYIKPVTAVPGTKDKAPVKPLITTGKSSNMFRLNKGRMPCPVNGTISMRFGRAFVDPVWLDNQFLTFAAAAGTPVTVIYDGEVTAVNKDEDVFTVLVLHGDIYTIYSNLQSASVEKGQKITGGTVIGKTAVNIATGKGELEFGVFENKKLVNPEPWITCR